MELLKVFQNVDSLVLKPLDTIASNTTYDFYNDGNNLMAHVAIIVSIVSVGVAWFTYKKQSSTESNTKNLSKSAQRSMLEELYRHLYRNMVITYTMKTKLEDINYEGYPSEEHLLKLKIPMENLQLKIFYGDDGEYKIFHELYLKFRNYNTEIDVAVSHFKDASISVDVKQRDLDTLIMKCSYLTAQIINTIKGIWKVDENDSIMIVKKMIEGEEGTPNTKSYAKSFPIKDDVFVKYENKKNEYATIVYNDEIDKFLEKFNNDVLNERGYNAENGWKVYMIKFKK